MDVKSFEPAKLRAAHAKRRIEDLRQLFQDYAVEHSEIYEAIQFPGEAPRLYTKYDPPDLPLICSVLVGEVVYNLRSALDYLVYTLAARSPDGPANGTQFPIVDCEEDFERLRPSYLKHVEDADVDAIRELQPYMGTEWTRTLRELSNPDKHRHLTVLDLTHFPKVGGTGTFEGTDQPFIDAAFTFEPLVADTREPVVSTLDLLQASVSETIQLFERSD